MSKFRKAAAAAGVTSMLIMGAVVAPTTFAHGIGAHVQSKINFTPPAAVGTVSAINGNTISITGKNGVIYTVDAASASVVKVTTGAKNSQTTINVLQIQVGDTLVVFGTVSSNNITASRIVDGWENGKRGFGPMLMGKVTAVSENTITVLGKNNTSYSVDAASAKISKISAGTKTTITVSGISVGDSVMVTGTVTGSNIVATQLVDGAFAPFKGGHKFVKNHSKAK